MEPRHQVSRAGIELIKRFEGYRARAARLPDGRHVIGYGHTRSARSGAEVSQADAEALLRYDLREVEAALEDLVFTPLNRNQTDALAAFAFSVGLDAFRRSNVLRRINEGDYLGAAAALESWRRAEFEGEPLVVDALIRRRAAEKILFLTPAEGFIAAPSAVLKPELDYGALPAREPVQAAELVTPLEGEEAAAERVKATAPAQPVEPSPALLAAENVSRRLKALFADEDTPPAQPPLDDRPPELASDPALIVSASAAEEPELLLAHPSPDDEPAPELDAAAETTEVEPDPDQAFDRRIARTEPDPELAGAARPERESVWPYVALLVLSLGLLGLALAIIGDAQGAGEPLFGPKTVTGLTLGGVGVVGAATAVWFWLRTLGERGGEPPAD
jgi:lysozyme